jgi:hypothetical protein
MDTCRKGAQNKLIEHSSQSRIKNFQQLAGMQYMILFWEICENVNNPNHGIFIPVSNP